MKDNVISQLIEKEVRRQNETIELIASENFVSNDVLTAQGSVLTNKYAEGYPYKRYYGGTEVVDEIEQLAINRACELFHVKHANVQPHSGSQANMAVYTALLDANDVVLGMDLSAGGHLTHGSSVNFSGKSYQFVSYGVDKQTEMIDYDNVRSLAIEYKPKLIISGASAYSRTIDFKKFREIADEVNAYLMVDMAHIAGLVATGRHPSPIEHAHVVTSTTHKTLRGPRGGLILTNDDEIAKKINSAIFPGIQGGPLEHVIAAKAVAFYEALQPEFTTYIDQVVRNARAMADEFKNRGYRVISGGTDNHMFMIDVTEHIENGKVAQELLDSVGITTNKNSIPFETLSPFKTSGLRIGTAAMTTRGFDEKTCRFVAGLIVDVIERRDDEKFLEYVREDIQTILRSSNKIDSAVYK